MKVKVKHLDMIKVILAIWMLYEFCVKVAPYNQNHFAMIRAEILPFCWATSSMAQFIKTKTFLCWILRQGAVPLSVKRVIMKLFYHHIFEFGKCNTNNWDLIQQPLTSLGDCLMSVCMCVYGKVICDMCRYFGVTWRA